MNRTLVTGWFLLLPLALAGAMASCGDAVNPGGSAAADAGDDGQSAGPSDARPRNDAAQPDTGLDASKGTSDAAAIIGSIELTLDPALDTEDGTVKAVTLTSVDLLDPAGARVASAVISGGVATVRLDGLGPGDYFLEVNGDADDLVPTRIDDPGQEVSQRVGTTLQASLVGPAGAPVYRIKTYSTGQAGAPVVRYSDGTPLAPAEQPYVLITLAPPKIEFLILGSGAALSSYAPMLSEHVGIDVPMDAWVLNTDGVDHHGDTFLADGGAASCAGCHWKMADKPVAYSSTTLANGFCFRCHYGAGGSDDGFLDPRR